MRGHRWRNRNRCRHRAARPAGRRKQRHDRRRREDVLSATAAKLSGEFGAGRVKFATCDITDSEQVDAAIELAGEGGHVSLVVANAGGVGPGGLAPFLYIDQQAWVDICMLNVVGTANILRSAAWNLRKHGGGAIVAISSSAAVGPELCNAHYPATKAGVDMLVRNAAQELVTSESA